MSEAIELDAAVVADAMRVTGQATGKAAVEEVVRTHVRTLEQLRALDDLRGIGWDGPSLDELRAHRFDPG